MNDRFLVPRDARSWVEVPSDSHFPIQNLPFGLACREDDCELVVVRIGDYAIDLCELSLAGLLPAEDFPILHSLIDLAQDDMTRLRRAVYDLLREDNPALRDDAELRAKAMFPMEKVVMLVPLEIPQLTNFHAGIHHEANLARWSHPDAPQLPANYRHVPIGYGGRASSILPSDTPVPRPKGQTLSAGAVAPEFGPSRELDFELEIGAFVGEGNEFGDPISAEDAEAHLLGLVLVNDWSARDVQRWEGTPLGPFLAKSFATSISPWIVTMDALEPFRVAGDPQEPTPLPHLRTKAASHYDLHLEVAIQTPRMSRPQTVARTNARHLYWSLAQMIAHQTSNGTPLEPGDLIASGGISGPDSGSFGSLIEITENGTVPLRMEETGEERTYLEDGDTVVFTGYAQGDGYRVGFGELRTTLATLK